MVQPVGQIATRPSGITGAFQTFVESAMPNVIRSQGDDSQVVKVRRRATAAVKTADATVIVKAAEVALWHSWYEDSCQGGVLPTRFKIPPSCTTEQVWRFAAPLQYDWSVEASGKACRITIKLEQLPHWIGA